MPIPPAGTASPSRMARSMPPWSMRRMTTGSVAHSTYSSGGRSASGRRPSARRTWVRTVWSSLYTRTVSGRSGAFFCSVLTRVIVAAAPGPLGGGDAERLTRA